jgi:hypothetical protein
MGMAASGARRCDFPELNATVSIAVLERGHRALRHKVIERIVALLEP